jgi:hypothetical protein
MDGRRVAYGKKLGVWTREAVTPDRIACLADSGASESFLDGSVLRFRYVNHTFRSSPRWHSYTRTMTMSFLRLL